MESQMEDKVAEALLRKLSDYVLERYATKVYEEAQSLALRAELSLEGIAEDELDAALERVIGIDPQ